MRLIRESSLKLSRFCFQTVGNHTRTAADECLTWLPLQRILFHVFQAILRIDLECFGSNLVWRLAASINLGKCEMTPHSRVRQDDPSPNLRALGSAISRVRQDTFAEKVKVRQENITAPWGSARSALSEFLAFRKIILLNLLWGVILRFLKICFFFRSRPGPAQNAASKKRKFRATPRLRKTL